MHEPPIPITAPHQSIDLNGDPTSSTPTMEDSATILDNVRLQLHTLMLSISPFIRNKTVASGLKDYSDNQRYFQIAFRSSYESIVVINRYDIAAEKMNHPSTSSSPVIPLDRHHQQQLNHAIVRITPQTVPPPMPPPPPNLPCKDLLQGSREDYIKVGVPLYEAAIKGDWKAARPILKEHPDLIRFAITENYETLLHIAASAESNKDVEEFVINLVQLMEKEDLELQNKNYNTALSLAAAAGNVKTAMTMVKKNPHLIDIPGKGRIMPLYMAALFGKPEMVRYLYDKSKKMTGDFWDDENQGWVLQKCVEAEIFDVALKMVNDCPNLFVKKESLIVKKGLLTDVLLALAQKTQAFKGIRPHIIFRIINSRGRANDPAKL
ncbi:hypothetical protein L1987_09343 [Smallanthus sonchifolius]|uniref:Uncharacterized protein n=1 Tax=Smallanthus sonchifolius TaxID=185202 RepID=A0ACB9JPF2_9ASTR|nr:hypothetical protein L1987_09343 [Smallanthus sonchifolius]